MQYIDYQLESDYDSEVQILRLIALLEDQIEDRVFHKVKSNLSKVEKLREVMTSKETKSFDELAEAILDTFDCEQYNEKASEAFEKASEKVHQEILKIFDKQYGLNTEQAEKYIQAYKSEQANKGIDKFQSTYKLLGDSNGMMQACSENKENKIQLNLEKYEDMQKGSLKDLYFLNGINTITYSPKFSEIPIIFRKPILLAWNNIQYTPCTSHIVTIPRSVKHIEDAAFSKYGTVHTFRCNLAIAEDCIRAINYQLHSSLAGITISIPVELPKLKD